MSAHHRRTKSKPTISPKFPQSKCVFCQQTRSRKKEQLVQNYQLNHKYLLRDIDAGMSCRFDNFVNGKLKLYPGGYQQFKKQYTQTKTIRKFFTLKQTSQNITNLIQKHCKEDNVQLVHYHDWYFKTMVRYHQRKKDVFLKNKYLASINKHSDDANNKSTDVGDAKAIKNVKSQKQTIGKKISPGHKSINKKGIKKKNQSFMEMENLTKRVEKMYRKGFGDGNALLEGLQRQMRVNFLIENEKEDLKRELEFQKELQQKISFIRDKPKSIRKKKKGSKSTHDEDLYGLRKSNISIEKEKISQKYTNKRTSTETYTQKIYPLTPASHGIHSPAEYFCTQKYSDIQPSYKKGTFNKKGRDSSSKSKHQRSNSRLKSKSKPKENYKFMNKLTKVKSQEKFN